jgi:uncharacterized protein (TIGR03435 family)
MRYRHIAVLILGILLMATAAAAQRNTTAEARLRSAMDKETVDGDLKSAIDGYRQVIAQPGTSRDVVAQALLRLGLALEKQGDPEARQAFERLTREFSDQTALVQQARARLARPRITGVTIRRNQPAEALRAVPEPRPMVVGPTRLQVMPGGRLVGQGISTMELIREGYGYVGRPASDISGPEWLDAERFDVAITTNRTEFGSAQPMGLLPQDAAEVVRQLLADRFKVHVRAERSERDIYELRVASADRQPGPGLRLSTGTCFGIYAPPGLVPRCPFVLGGGQGFATGNITMTELAMLLGSFPAINATVVDRTGLPGAFDVRMTKFVGGTGAAAAAVGAAGAGRPDVFNAVQDMLGLRLEPARGMVDVLVVERAEKPIED